MKRFAFPRAITVIALATLISPSFHPGASAQESKRKVYEQVPQKADAVVRPDFAAKQSRETTDPIETIDFTQGSTPDWIWGPDNNQEYRLKTTFTGNFKAAYLKASCDNRMKVFLNGKQVASSSEWQEPVTVNVSQHIASGDNELIAEVANAGGVAAFVAKLVLVTKDGQRKEIVTNEGWQIVDKEGTVTDANVELRGKLGDAPWNNVFESTGLVSSVPRETFVTLPGFEVEKLFTVPSEELGSWVSITVDPQGRLLACDQKEKGLCRITPSPIGSDQPTQVEHLDLAITSAQGLLYAFDSLYLSVNGGPGSGLYRARDTNQDDQFDELVKQRDFQGGGEHGPHALRLSPDGKSIYVICGNHTNPPFNAGDDQGNPDYSSRIPSNWGEDLLLPRQWDANGHARGRMAPGGWIAKTDPDGESWEIFSIGYRNPYDMDFNLEGDLFAYDADMEWDMGTPWYRPTRAVHATSGSEFGWRSGTGKWPTYYPDSLPPLVNLGPGSPVGICFGYGTQFPQRYQRALYLCDWTFGTIYAVHMKPDGSSYRAEKEEFLSRSPLPLTDIVVGHDGALYLTVGGRGAQSELYRVTYNGPEATEPVTDLGSSQFAALRQRRREIESLHRDDANVSSGRLRELVDVLGHGDRFLRYAARIALEKQPVDRWENLVLDQSDPSTVINGVVGLARQGQPDLQPQLVNALAAIDFNSLPSQSKLELLRAWQLVFIRLGEPNEETRQQLVQQYDPYFPVQEDNGNQSHEDGAWVYSSMNSTDALNRELSRFLVYLKSSEVISEAVALMAKDREKSDSRMKGLLARNRGYGRSIAGMLENPPDLQQVHYAFVLRNLKEGWSLKDRKTYFRWFQKAQEWSGGNSYRKFLQNISDEAYANATEAERLAIEASGARQPFQVPELPEPHGPGKDWSVEEVMQLAEEKLSSNRNYENGKKMFAATRCIVCHRFQGEGGATGPDLTQLAGRFNLKDLTEAIIEPSKDISDQYRAMQIVTVDGEVLNGRIVSENEQQLTVLTDPEDSTKVVDVSRNDIELMQPSQSSLMPKDLLKPLNEQEVLDLLAYLLSRGNPNDSMFKKQ